MELNETFFIGALIRDDIDGAKKYLDNVRRTNGYYANLNIMHLITQHCNIITFEWCMSQLNINRSATSKIYMNCVMYDNFTLARYIFNEYETYIVDNKLSILTAVCSWYLFFTKPVSSFWFLNKFKYFCIVFGITREFIVDNLYEFYRACEKFQFVILNCICKYFKIECADITQNKLLIDHLALSKNVMSVWFECKFITPHMSESKQMKNILSIADNKYLNQFLFLFLLDDDEKIFELHDDDTVHDLADLFSEN